MNKKCSLGFVAVIAASVVLAGCGDGAWNNPYPAADHAKNILYRAFTERPKHLDPVRAYSSNEYAFIAQIYEPPLQYHYLDRPYRLVSLTAEGMPEIRLFDAVGSPLGEDAPASQVAFSEYRIEIQKGIRYQPHPAFARDAQGSYLYHRLGPAEIDRVRTLTDLPIQSSRELIAEDYVYQIKRLAVPDLHSPIAGLLGEYIVGFVEFPKKLHRLDSKSRAASYPFRDLRDVDLEGVTPLDRYRFRIRLRGKYPQFLFWLAMPFFSPMPWEADAFYSQEGLADRNLTLDWYPVGTGPYMLAENNPNLRMVLERNPNFHNETYPESGAMGDSEPGLLIDAGRPLPFVDRAVYSLEKENIPYWSKFLQGYYDSSGISSDSFDQAIQLTAQGNAVLTPAMEERGIQLASAVSTSIFYLGFNIRDPVIGGAGERARLLRRAISIAVDYEEYLSIFANGRGIVADGPLPPGIFGNRGRPEDFNPYVFRRKANRVERRPLEDARELLRLAGYGDGVDSVTGEPLVLYFDTTATGPDDKARLNWFRKQFGKLGIQLVVRATDYNRFQEKMREGTAQIFSWGWNADYPDPENFLFLLYGPNGKVENGGENAANYSDPEYDRLFDRMKNMENGEEREALVERMVEILRRDAPWLWGFHPKELTLHHAWVHNVQPNLMANNTLKYRRLEPKLRAERRVDWNRPVIWPLWLGIGLIVVAVLPAILAFRRRERAGGR